MLSEYSGGKYNILADVLSSSWTCVDSESRSSPLHLVAGCFGFGIWHAQIASDSQVGMLVNARR